jgi:hypothetical protein
MSRDIKKIDGLNLTSNKKDIEKWNDYLLRKLNKNIIDEITYISNVDEVMKFVYDKVNNTRLERLFYITLLLIYGNPGKYKEVLLEGYSRITAYLIATGTKIGIKLFPIKNCPICFNEFNLESDNNLLVTRCGHLFHDSCILHSEKCPICRSILI